MTRRSSTGPLETVADDAVPTGYETDTGRNCSTERVLQEQYGKTAAHEGYEAQSETDEVRHVSHLGRDLDNSNQPVLCWLYSTSVKGRKCSLSTSW